jgi:hypothetical protein
MNSKIDSPTTIQITKNSNRQLSILSTFSGIDDKGNIIEPFIQDLFRKCRPLLMAAIKTGQNITFDYEITVQLKEDLVKGSFPCAMDESRDTTDAKMMAEIESCFRRLDNEKELNKIKFVECLEKEFNTKIQLPKEPKKIKEKIGFTCEVA